MIQGRFRQWLAKQREAENRSKEEQAASQRRQAQQDTEEERAIIANLCQRQDLHYPSAAEVREALRMARGDYSTQ